jgi:hypothetical protein
MTFRSFVLPIFTIFVGSASLAQTLPMTVQGDLTAAQLTAMDIRNRQEQSAPQYWSQNSEFDNPFVPEVFNSFNGGGGRSGSDFSPSVDFE